MTAAVFLVFSLSFFLDLLFRSHGIASALTPFCLVYYTVVLGWKAGLLLALVAAIPSAVFSGCPFPCELIVYPVTAGLSLWNLHRSGVGDPPLRGHILLGALIPVLTFGPQALTASRESLMSFLTWIFPLSAGSALLLPAFIFLLDFFAEKLALPLYAGVFRNRERTR